MRELVNTENMSRSLAKLGLKLLRDESGTVAVEYVIVSGLLAVALILPAAALADSVRIWFWQKVISIVSY